MEFDRVLRASRRLTVVAADERVLVVGLNALRAFV